MRSGLMIAMLATSASSLWAATVTYQFAGAMSAVSVNTFEFFPPGMPVTGSISIDLATPELGPPNPNSKSYPGAISFAALTVGSLQLELSAAAANSMSLSFGAVQDVLSMSLPLEMQSPGWSYTPTANAFPQQIQLQLNGLFPSGTLIDLEHVPPHFGHLNLLVGGGTYTNPDGSVQLGDLDTLFLEIDLTSLRVPEPDSLALFCLGSTLLGSALILRRRNGCDLATAISN